MPVQSRLGRKCLSFKRIGWRPGWSRWCLTGTDGTLDSVVLTNHEALAPIQAPAPVLRGGDPAELVELPDFFQTRVDELPGAWHIRTDLAAVFL